MDDRKKGCFGCLGTLGIIFIAFAIIVAFSINNTDKKEELTSEEIATIKDVIIEFETNAAPYIETTKGIVKDIKMFDVIKSDDFYVYVYIDESSWAKSTESEKTSVATTIGKSMEKIAGDTPIHAFIVSATNDDILAEPSGSKYKIIR